MRYGVTLACERLQTSAWPHATLLVNLSGSLALGVLSAFVLQKDSGILASEGIFAIAIGAGFLGSYTTYSSFALQVYTLHKMGRRIMAGMYAGTTLLGGLLAFAIGFLGGTWL